MSNETDTPQNYMRRMKSSNNVGAILHGDPSQCSHYIDELDRFTRNFADVDKRVREQQRLKKMEVMDSRRRLNMYKEMVHQEHEDIEAKKYFQSIAKSQKMHETRLKKTAHTNSLPFNPINHQYDSTPSGEQLHQHDSQNKVKQLVRAHNLITRGTCGYNVINGQSEHLVQKLVPEEMQNNFTKRLADHYEHYRLKANSSLSHNT